MANKITVLIEAQTKKASSALNQFRTSVGQADGAVGKFKAGTASAFAALKANAGAAALVAGAAFLGFAKQSIQAASDLAESTNAVEKAFEDSSGAVLKLGSDSVDSYGLSESAFNSMAVGFSAYAKMIAGEGGNVGDVIDGLATRTADLSSVFNTSVEEMGNKIRSGLSGEVEPLKSIGIVMNANAVAAKAMELGLADSKSELTEANKVQARYAIILEQTNQYAGDFADTQDGLANGTRKLQAGITDLQASFGESLVPALSLVVEGLNAATEASDALKLSMDGDAFTEEETFIDRVNNAVMSSINPVHAFMRAGEGIKNVFGSSAPAVEKAADAISSVGARAEYTDTQLGYVDGKMREIHRTGADLQGSQVATAGAIADAGRAAQVQKDRMQDLEDQYRSLMDQAAALVGGELAVERATMAMNDAMEVARVQVAEGNTPDNQDYERALNNAAQSTLDAATATADYEIAQREANGELLDADAKNRILADHLDYASMTALPEVQAQTAGWSQKLRDIPDDVETTMAVNTSRADAFLASWLSLPRSMKINAKVDAPTLPGVSYNIARKDGGPIPGGKNQAVPITAHGGEYVLDAGTVDAIKRGKQSAGSARGSGSGGGGGVGMDPTEFGRMAADAFAKRMQQNGRAR